MNDDLKPNGRNYSYWSPEGAYMISKLIILRLRDQIANEGIPTTDAVDALNAAVEEIEKIETTWMRELYPL